MEAFDGKSTPYLQCMDETLAQLAGATVFSKQDANNGFWQVPLSKESQLLTTFITPFGRYCFTKLPIGISSAPEIFQKRIKKELDRLEEYTQMDDVPLFGTNKSEHDTHVE